MRVRKCLCAFFPDTDSDKLPLNIDISFFIFPVDLIPVGCKVLWVVAVQAPLFANQQFADTTSQASTYAEHASYFM